MVSWQYNKKVTLMIDLYLLSILISTVYTKYFHFAARRHRLAVVYVIKVYNVRGSPHWPCPNNQKNSDADWLRSWRCCCGQYYLGILHTCYWRRGGMGDVGDSEVKWANVEDLGKMSIVDFYSDQWLSDAMCQVQAACEPVSLRAQIRGKYPVCAKVPHHISGIFSHCSLNLEGY